LPELEALLDPRHVLDKAEAREPAIESILAETQGLLDLLADRYECPIPVFVSSCRVFGYGVETAMLVHIAKLIGVGTAREKLIGKYKATAQNHWAKGMYADHGFVPSDAGFVWRGAPAIASPSWAKIAGRLTSTTDQHN